MQKPVNILNQALTPSFFCVMTLFLIFSCSQNNTKQYEASKKENELKPPVTITGKAPIVTVLDTCPPPRTITIPTRKEDSFVLKISNSGTVFLPPFITSASHSSSPVSNAGTVILPPETKPADFSVLMQNYNTDQGLGYSAVSSGCMDKSGNLWFATFGGGVSRYDGKSFTTYTAAMGLASNLVTSILEAKDGNLWFGTIGGVSCYNGRFFTNYTTDRGLANNRVRSIAEDKMGNLWFGTIGGVSKYDGKSFTNFATSQGLINNEVNSVLQDKSGNLWFGTSGGVSRYDGKSFKSYTSSGGLTSNYVTSILEDKNGYIWFGTVGGVCRLDPQGSFYRYADPMELVNKNISSMLEDKRGYIWFGTREGVFRLKEDGSIMNFNSNRGLVNNKVNSILTDQTGTLWFCTENGVSRFDQDGKFLFGYTIAQGLTNNAVMRICEDKGGNLWFGTNGGGVSRLDRDGKVFTHYTTAQGLANNVVRSIAEDKMGNLWFGTEGGVSQLDPARKVFKIYTTLQGLPDNRIRSITEDKAGNIWFSTAEGGVSRFDQNKKNITTYTTDQGLPNNFVRKILEDKTGNLWFNTLGGGVSRLDQHSKSPPAVHPGFINYTTAQGLANNLAFAMVEDKNGNLWIGSEVGVSRYDGKSFVTYTTADGLSNNAVGDIVMDADGVIWLGTEKGITALRGFARDGKQSREFSRDGNLKPSNELSNTELKNAGFKPVFEIYNSTTGYQIKEINAMFVTREGIIWAGTGSYLGDKLISFDFRGVHKNPDPPNVFIHSIKINNETISWYGLIAPGGYLHSTSIPAREGHKPGEPIDSMATTPNIPEEGAVLGKILSDEQRAVMREKYSDIKFDSITRFYPLPVNLVLPYRHNNLTFDFAAIEPARPFLVRYQYMLAGYDKEWSPVTDQTSAAFGNMYEGNYTFKLKAQSPDGVWSEPVSYAFKVLPPLHRTWWAYTSYILAFLTALWIFIKWRLRALKKEKTILEEKVARRTRELREEKEKVETTLTELRSTQAQLIQSEKMASLGELTAGIAHEIQNPLNFVNNFSDVNSELIEDLYTEIREGNQEEAIAIANFIKANEEKINHHGKRADAIVKGMLQHSRSSSGVKESKDINKLADEYLRLAYHGLRAKDKSFNATLNTDYDECIGTISIIPQDIGRVVLNLINNAFYAVAEKKKQSGTDYEPTILVSTKKLIDSIEISVRDNGTGIPQKVVNKIFQPFFTTKPTGQGTGLGLSLAYDIVKAHGGELKTDTKEGEGSEFTIQLPIN